MGRRLAGAGGFELSGCGGRTEGETPNGAGGCEREGVCGGKGPSGVGGGGAICGGMEGGAEGRCTGIPELECGGGTLGTGGSAPAAGRGARGAGGGAAPAAGSGALRGRRASSAMCLSKIAVFSSSSSQSMSMEPLDVAGVGSAAALVAMGTVGVRPSAAAGGFTEGTTGTGAGGFADMDGSGSVVPKAAPEITGGGA